MNPFYEDKLKALSLQLSALPEVELDGSNLEKHRLFFVKIATAVISDPGMMIYLTRYPRFINVLRKKYQDFLTIPDQLYLENKNLIDSVHKRLLELPI